MSIADNENGTLAGLIEQCRGPPSPDASAHQRIVRGLRGLPPHALSPEQRFEALGYLREYILGVADEKRLYIERIALGPSGQAMRFTVVDERPFPEEVALMRQLSKPLRYSQALLGWLAERRQTLARSLREDSSFMNKLDGWRSATPEQRLGLLREIIHRSIELHGSADIPLVTPPVRLDEEDGEYGAATRTRTDGRMVTAAELRVRIGRPVLEDDDFLEPLLTAYHESLHCVTIQLAMAVEQGRVTESHPLYNDAKLCLALVQSSRGAPDRRLDSEYSGHFNESFVYSNERLFGRELKYGEGLSARFRACAEACGATLRSSARAAAHRVGALPSLLLGR